MFEIILGAILMALKGVLIIAQTAEPVIVNLNDPQLWRMIGTALGTIAGVAASAFAGWKKWIKPWFEKTVVRSTNEINDQVNNGRIKRMEDRIKTNSATLENVENDLGEMRERQSEMSGKIDMIVEFTKRNN